MGWTGADCRREVDRVLRALERWGLLLQADAHLPSAVRLVLGGSYRGSWWAHPRTHEVYDVLVAVKRRAQVLEVKLVAGKVTYVHRRLWPALAALGNAREPWQRRGLSPGARALLARVDRVGALRSDELATRRGTPRSKRPGARVRELEARLLLYSEEFHADGGAHAKRIETWAHWAARCGVDFSWLTADGARTALESAAAALAAEAGLPVRLPWTRIAAPAASQLA